MKQILKILIKPDTGKISGIVVIVVAVLIWPPKSPEVIALVSAAIGALSALSGRGGNA